MTSASLGQMFDNDADTIANAILSAGPVTASFDVYDDFENCNISHQPYARAGPCRAVPLLIVTDPCYLALNHR